MSLFVAAYDISEDRARRAVARILERAGRRVQESVFEVDLSRRGLRSLLGQVGPQLGRSDSFDLFPVDARRLADRRSWGRRPLGYDPFLIVSEEGAESGAGQAPAETS